VTLTIFGSTVGYLSDSLASCCKQEAVNSLGVHLRHFSFRVWGVWPCWLW